jgi:transcriptional regulator with XRE-family HTH domain
MVTAGESADFVRRLQRERYARGWTQQQAIDRLKRLAHERGDGHRFDGLDVNTLSRYEHGRIRRPRAPLRALFAALYEMPAAELFPSRPSIMAAAGGRPVALLHAPAGAGTVRAGSGRVVLTVEELRALITDTTMQAVEACLSALVHQHGDEQGGGVI